MDKISEAEQASLTDKDQEEDQKLVEEKEEEIGNEEGNDNGQTGEQACECEDKISVSLS